MLFVWMLSLAAVILSCVGFAFADLCQSLKLRCHSITPLVFALGDQSPLWWDLFSVSSLGLVNTYTVRIHGEAVSGQSKAPVPLTPMSWRNISRVGPKPPWSRRTVTDWAGEFDLNLKRKSRTGRRNGYKVGTVINWKRREGTNKDDSECWQEATMEQIKDLYDIIFDEQIAEKTNMAMRRPLVLWSDSARVGGGGSFWKRLLHSFENRHRHRYWSNFMIQGHFQIGFSGYQSVWGGNLSPIN